MTVVASVDYTAKRIYLHADTVGVDLDTVDIYREVRTLRRTNENHRKFRPIITAAGNEEKVTGETYTPIFVKLWYGTRIVPYDTSQKLKVIRDTFTDDGVAGRDCFDRTALSPTSRVDIDVDFPEIEIRSADGGGTPDVVYYSHDAAIVIQDKDSVTIADDEHDIITIADDEQERITIIDRDALNIVDHNDTALAGCGGNQ